MALSNNERSVVDAYLAYRVRSEANVDAVTSPSSRDGTAVPAGAFAGVSSACSRLGSKALISQSRLLEAQLATMKVEEEKEELEIETLRLERARVVRTAEFLEQRAVECEDFKRSVERLLAEAKAEVRDAQRRNVTGPGGLGLGGDDVASKLFTTIDAQTGDGVKTQSSLTSDVGGGERKPYIISFEHHDKASGLTGHADPHALGVGVEDDKGRQNPATFGTAQSPVFVTTSETLARAIEEAKVVDALAAGCDVSPVVAYPAILEAIGREARAQRRADAYAATAEHAKAEAEESAVELRRAVAARSRDLLPQSQSLQNQQNQQNPQNAVLGSASVTNASSVGVGGVAAGAFGPKTVSRAVSEAQQKLEEAQREAFAARKRLLMTHKRLLGTERLPTGAVLPLSATVDVVAGIRRELAVGRLDTLHRLGATDCSDLMHLAENINGPAPAAATNPSASASRLGENNDAASSATGGLRRQQTGPLDSRQGTTVDGSYVGSAAGGDAASSSFHGSSSVHQGGVSAVSDEHRVGALPDNFALRAQQLGSATKAAQQAALFGAHSSPATPGGSNPPNLSSPSAAFPTSRGTIPISQATDFPRRSEFTTGSGLPAPSGSASHAMALPPPAQPMRIGATGRSGAPPQVTSQGIVSSNASVTSSVANDEGQDRVRREDNEDERGRPMRDVTSSHATAAQQRPGGVMTSEIFSQQREVAVAQERRGSGAGGDATRSMLQSFLRSRGAPPQ